MWDYDLAKSIKQASAKSDLEKAYYKGTYSNGSISLYGGRIKFALSNCDMVFHVRYQMTVDFDNQTAKWTPRSWTNGDTVWCVLDGGSVLIVGMNKEA